MPGIAFDPVPYGCRDIRVYPLAGEVRAQVWTSPELAK
jgi:hypothetical protein